MPMKLRAALLLALACVAPVVTADELPDLTLAGARAMALDQQPRLVAAERAVQAAEAAMRVARADYFPQIQGNVTAAGTDAETLDARIAAGGLNNPTVLPRESNGVLIDQLVTDFGRTNALVASAGDTRVSRERRLDAARATVLLDVTRAFYGALAAQAVLTVAEQTLASRELLLERVTTLAKNKLKSDLDVSFAAVGAEQARLLALRARNALDGAFAQLAAAIGQRDARRYRLVEAGEAPAPEPDVGPLLAAAIDARPELASLRADHAAALKLVAAEHDRNYPTVKFLAAAGVTPVGDKRFDDTYAAAGLNLSVPLFAGGRYRALEDEARARAEGVEATLGDEENRVVRDVRLAWLNARTGYEALAVTERLARHAARALELAQSSYGIGMSSIIELAQAELNATEGEIAHDRAKYEYGVALAALDFELGRLR
ncbi:MAG: TolC family protein [Gammaproteobacteria bacterium]|nr:TolC family protein [Gammaproteobacteria bacterium]